MEFFVIISRILLCKNYNLKRGMTNEKIFELYARFCNDGNYGYQCFAAVGSEGGGWF